MTDSPDQPEDQPLAEIEELLISYAALEAQWRELNTLWDAAVADQDQPDANAMQDIKRRAHVLRYQIVELLEQMAALDENLSSHV